MERSSQSQVYKYKKGIFGELFVLMQRWGVWEGGGIVLFISGIPILLQGNGIKVLAINRVQRKY